MYIKNDLIDLVFIGAGDSYWEVYDLINDINTIKPKYKIIAILDDNINLIGQKFNGVNVLGPIFKILPKFLNIDVKFIFGIGSFSSRVKKNSLLHLLNIPTVKFETLIHPTVKVYSNSKIGYGCILHYGSIIYNNSIINNFTLISASCVIGVRNLIGEGALLASGIITTTDIKIGSYSFIGAGVTIAPKVDIAAGAMIGLGTNVYRNVNEGEFVLGNPTKILRREKVSKEILDIWKNNIEEYKLFLK